MVKKAFLLPFLLLLGSAQAATPKDTLVIMQGSDLPTLDPGGSYDTVSGSLVENIYETLIGYTGSSIKKLEPMLATKWTSSKGGKTYTFDLRKGVKFHSGAAFTCKDAEYTFERHLVTNYSGAGSWFLAESLLGTQANANDDKTINWARIDKSVECNNAGQLVFNLAKPDGTFLSKLAFYGYGVVEQAYSAKLGEWSGTEKDWKAWIGKDLTDTKLSKAPNGTGAYRVVRQDANNVLFEAFPGYWGNKPDISKVLWQRVPEQAARFQAFLKGDADFIDGGGRTVDEAQLKGKPGVAWLDDLPNVTSPSLMMNESIKDPRMIGSGKLDGKGVPATFFADVNVRKAFSYSFNYAEYIKAVQGGKGMQRTMLVPDAFLGYDENVKKYTYDPAQATTYFKRAYKGELWKNGFTLTLSYRAGNSASQTNFEILKQGIEALNPKFHINLQAKQWSDLLADGRKGKEPIRGLTWTPDYADPDNFLYTFYASDGFFADVTGFRDTRMDLLLRRARTTNNTAERSKLYSQVGTRAFETAPILILPAEARYIFYRNNISGINAKTFNPMTSFMGGVLWKDLNKN